MFQSFQLKFKHENCQNKRVIIFFYSQKKLMSSWKYITDNIFLNPSMKGLHIFLFKLKIFNQVWFTFLSSAQTGRNKSDNPRKAFYQFGALAHLSPGSCDKWTALYHCKHRTEGSARPHRKGCTPHCDTGRCQHTLCCPQRLQEVDIDCCCLICKGKTERCNFPRYI